MNNSWYFCYPTVSHFIANEELFSKPREVFIKFSPETEKHIWAVTRGDRGDINDALRSAHASSYVWDNVGVIARADILRKVARIMEDKRLEIADTINLETGRSKKDCLKEVQAAIEQGYFWAGEGRRFFGRTFESASPNHLPQLRRVPVGVIALVVPFNNPFAACAWKSFPALLCGNAVILKAHEETPYTPVLFAKILKEAGVPSGVFNILQGFGFEVLLPLIKDDRVDAVSATCSIKTAKFILTATAERMLKVSIESGGKNALVVCDDADLEWAAECAIRSAFVDAGQRCAAGSRIIVFEKIYEKFKDIMLSKTARLKIGSSNEDDIGPVINRANLERLLMTVKRLPEGAVVLCGGGRVSKPGFFMEPTIIEGVTMGAEISQEELFGPITCLYSVKDLSEAIAFANWSKFALTSAVHTSSIHRAMMFAESVRAGRVSVNGYTFGSEPHMPFGGSKLSGNGWREPGPEALDFYSETKVIDMIHDPLKI
ncbi:MAG: aldehyde dehydrogenase [Candidatus Niyogibacteria bacterium CG10_big_fil_rev_8_21_14_0_10_42_19]|uniref:Aldehyde dehydrogenase n=1 Tax=Candidatus Niyogibacteria bacterium CG10_big_fil_rev_8_21_14_0_10_42_19 TaxID=1974725 RepID=A0A2H0TFQ5_9BACT|nr:MAG: aldehyde dehydrogenase [Candidatus Niyogibacteria bacterium CG10_big_fil_rev_8_21_14_0_10_42_19]